MDSDKLILEFKKKKKKTCKTSKEHWRRSNNGELALPDIESYTKPLWLKQCSTYWYMNSQTYKRMKHTQLHMKI